MKIDNKTKGYMYLITYSILLVCCFQNFSSIISSIQSVASVLMPFIIGFGIAFVLNIVLKFYENKILLFKHKCKRGIGILLTITTVITIFIGLIVFIVPQLIESVKVLGESIPGYIQSAQEAIKPLLQSTEFLAKVYEYMVDIWKDLFQLAGQFVASSVNGIVDTTVSATSGIITFCIGFVAAIYMLIRKELFVLQMKKILFAFLDENKAIKIIEIGKLTNETFSKFLAGQLTEAFILGVICFFAMIIMGMPFPLLISVIIGLTNMLPIVGPFIGSIPSAFILLMVSPKYAIWFVIFVIVIQQIESQLIYPKVVGTSIGLSPLWVLFAITVGGSLGGAIGMLLGVPTVAVLYKLISTEINNRLLNKNIFIENEQRKI